VIVLILNGHIPGRREEKSYTRLRDIRRLNKDMNEFRCPRCSGRLTPDFAHNGLYCEDGCRARWCNIMDLDT
jgi:hypothetical protein